MRTVVMEPKGAFARFRIFPDKTKRYYFEVVVFPSRKKMQDYYRDGFKALRGRGRTKDVDAVTIPYRKAEPPKLKDKQEIGTILLHRRQTGTGIVSHEMTHAAVHYLAVSRQRLPKHENDMKAEERLAWTVGNLTKQFFVRY